MNSFEILATLLKGTISRFPFVYSTLCTLLGIVMQKSYSIVFEQTIVLVILLCITCIVLCLYQVLYAKRLLICYLWFFCFGIVYPSFHAQEYVAVMGQTRAIVKIDSPAEEKPKTIAFDVLFITVEDSSVCAKSRLYIQKDSGAALLQYGDVIEIYGNFRPIINHEHASFDYAAYMAQQHIYSSAYIPSSRWGFIEYERSIRRYSYQLRARALQKIAHNITSGESMQIIAALGFGDKSLLDAELKNTFSQAGAMHILAVSGLHVGIISSIILLLVSPLFRLRLLWLQSIIVILAIWGYACVTGLSPSVQRAAIMFSVLSCGYLLRRQVHSLNTLAVAAFISFLVDPYAFYLVGFQLSYIAVAGIICGASKLMKIYTPSNIVISYVWGIIAVSIIVQIATFPISVYYFSHVPVYSLLTNICVIPLAFIILASLFFCFVPIISHYACVLVQKEVELLYYCLYRIKNLPVSSYEVYISFTDMIGLYVLLGGLYGIYLFVRESRLHKY